MSFSVRSYRRFPVQCFVTYYAGPFHGQGTIWNLSCTGWRLSGDLPMRPGETISLTVTLPNDQRIEIPEAVVKWSRGQEFAVENAVIEPYTHALLQHYVKKLVQESLEIILRVRIAPSLRARSSSKPRPPSMGKIVKALKVPVAELLE